MTLSAIIVDKTLVLDRDVVTDVVWPATLYDTPVNSIHAVQSYGTHTVVEFTNPTRFNETFRDDIHNDNRAILVQIHADAKAAQPVQVQTDPAVMARLDKLMEAERDYGKVQLNGHEYHSTPTFYGQLTLLKGMGKVYIIDVNLEVVELTAGERATLRDMIGPQIKLMANEYRKLLEL